MKSSYLLILLCVFSFAIPISYSTNGSGKLPSQTKYAALPDDKGICINLQLAYDPGNIKVVVRNTVPIFTDSRPWARWWWFAAMIDRASVRDNLVWLKNNGFGGVEIAWVYPTNMRKKDTINYTPRQAWLSSEWTEMVVYAKKCADSLGMGCDFTFGTLWPFGDSKVPFNEATMNMKDSTWRQDLTRSWEYPAKGYVIDHLNHIAFDHYAERIGNALKPALAISPSSIFCDSWEVETKYLSTPGFKEAFFKQYGYSIDRYIDSLYSNNRPYKDVRYDYMKLVSDYVIREFYKPFTLKAHELGGTSRVQCAGAPCDIISAYATADIPETEALLYEPAYANIVASAADLSGKNVVSSETFTCLYGWPGIHHSEEQTADLKLLADAIFANGVNHVIWHGKPYNKAGTDTTKFYASVHVGASGALAAELPAFNDYMAKVSSYMKMGTTYSDVAVYLPTEDNWIAGELPIEKQLIWAWGYYEQRNTYLPEELKAYRPLWINEEFLKKAQYHDGILSIGNLAFKALYIDVKYMDTDALARIVELAKSGLPVCLKQKPQEPGFIKTGNKYEQMLGALIKCSNVKTDWKEITEIKPFITGTEKLDYWCRKTDKSIYIFFANPKAKGLTFPLAYGQSLSDKKESLQAEVHYNGNTIPLNLVFEPYQSLLFKIDTDGKVTSIDIHFLPKTPVYIPRVKNGREKWEVDPGAGK